MNDDTDDTERVDIVAADILANALQELNMLDTGKFGPGGHRYTVDNTGFVRRGEATELSPYAHVEAALMVALTRLAGAPERVEELRRHLFDGDTADILASLRKTWAQEDAERAEQGAVDDPDDPPAAVTFTNMSTPASFGAEWTARNSGTRFQLVNPRGTTTLLFGAKPDGSEQWSTTRVVGPERFGMDKPPRSFTAFRRIAAAYVNA